MKRWYVVSASLVAVLVFLATFWGFPGSPVFVVAGTTVFGRDGHAWPAIATLSFVVDTAVVWLLLWLASRSAR